MLLSNTSNGISGFSGVSYLEEDKAKSMYVSQLFLDKGSVGVLRIMGWTIDLDGKAYQEQVKSILSTFKFIDKN